ncbi:MAG: DUF2061 domain-containing protein [Pseudomonadota bacterium]
MTDFTVDDVGKEDRPSSGHSSERAWRSFAKALTWRVIGTLDTFFLSFFIIKYLGPMFGLADESTDLEIAATASFIAITEVITKIVIYTTHERIWNRINWGVAQHRLRYETRLRSAAKMSTWRVLASLDTMLLAWLFTGNLGTAISIGGLEVLTKLVLYFFHERLWLKIKLGLET